MIRQFAKFSSLPIFVLIRYPCFTFLPGIHLKLDQRVQKNNSLRIHLNVHQYTFECIPGKLFIWTLWSISWSEISVLANVQLFIQWDLYDLLVGFNITLISACIWKCYILVVTCAFVICLICMPSALGLRPSGFGHTYQANPLCPCYNYYLPFWTQYRKVVRILNLASLYCTFLKVYEMLIF